MSATETQAITRKIYSTFFAGDVEGWLDFFATDGALVEADTLPYGGRHVGRDAIRSAMLTILDTWNDLAFDIVEILGGEHSSIAYGFLSGSARTTGRPIRFATAERWVFVDGKVQEVSAIYGDTAQALAALAGSAA